MIHTAVSITLRVMDTVLPESEIPMSILLHEELVDRTSAPESLQSITVEKYPEMIDSGEIEEDRRVELIRGRLVPKMPQGDPQVLTSELLIEWLNPRLPSAWFTRSEKHLRLADSEPEPDVMIVRGNRRDYARRRPVPADLALVVEVASSSLGYDRRTKKELYAAGGIPCYWIINLDDMQIEVFENPVAGNYEQSKIYKANEPVPIAVDGREIGRVSLAEISE